MTSNLQLAKRLFNEAFYSRDDYFHARSVKENADSTVRRKIYRIAKDVGVKLSRREARSDWIARNSDNGATFCWDGKTIAMGLRNLHDIIHDVAHHQCAAPSRRPIPEWGLGTSPDGTKDAKLIISRDSAQREEECASILGILWERAIGMYWTGTALDHSWDMPHGKDQYGVMARAIGRLRSWNLIDDDLNPLPNLRPAKTRV